MPSSLERYKLSLFILVMLPQLCFFSSGLVLTQATSKHYSPVYTKQNAPHTIPATSFLGRGETRPVILAWHCLFMTYYYYLDICKSTFKRQGFFFLANQSCQTFHPKKDDQSDNSTFSQVQNLDSPTHSLKNAKRGG